MRRTVPTASSQRQRLFTRNYLDNHAGLIACPVIGIFFTRPHVQPHMLYVFSLSLSVFSHWISVFTRSDIYLFIFAVHSILGANNLLFTEADIAARPRCMFNPMRIFTQS